MTLDFLEYHTIMEPSAIQHIESKPGVCGGQPCVAGTWIRVQDIYVWLDLLGKTPDEIVTDFPQLTLADVHAAMAYFWNNRQEFQRQMKFADELVAGMKQKYPSKPRQKLAGKEAEPSPIPS